MKRLSELVAGLPGRLSGSADPEVSDILFDSRKVTAGTLFLAFKGVHQDGHQYIEAAVKAGAVAVVTEADVSDPGVPVFRVENALRSLAPLSVRLWDNPSKDLLMVGITGTNGKTTTAFLVESLLARAGMNPGLLGTIQYRFGGKSIPAPNTTPFANDLQRFLRQVVDGGGKACVMEVSSHALALGRVEGVEFDVAVFTNLTQDHLDFHGTMEAYMKAKAKLFDSLDPASSKRFAKRAIVNKDDAWADRVSAGSRVPVWGYSVRGSSDVNATDIVSDARGSRFTLSSPKGTTSIQVPLLGDYNIANAIAAAAVGLSQGLSLDQIRAGLAEAPNVPGRMERIDEGQPFTVVVDYAHTEDALRKVLGTLRRLNPRKLITVFGCGGDRDRTKRPLMGQAAAELSDEVYVTSDNPRSEDPSRIALDVEVGIRRVRPTGYHILIDRRDALEAALGSARMDDIVLIAGKGHETYQILSDKTIPFDDRAVSRELLRRRSDLE